MIKEKFYTYIESLQDKIAAALEDVDKKSIFKEDIWKREEGGGGRSRILENGAVFEKAGVNISKVYGKLPETMQNYFKVSEAEFFACGLSLVFHPKSPMVPTVHANWRYFELYDKNGTIQDQWFGGGQDLTPYYLFEEDAKYFHEELKKVCEKHPNHSYEEYKKKCDDYFWNAHRNEARGIGGLFFDYVRNTQKHPIDETYQFITDMADNFIHSYLPIVQKRKDMSYGDTQKEWQQIRRGRYVEFNLIHDKGTLFGLKTKGRIESIFMSLPPVVQWKYNWTPEKNSEEEKLIQIVKKPVNWVS